MRKTYRKMPSQEELKAFANYDPETGVFTRLKTSTNWARFKAGDKLGTLANGYININVNYRIYRAHRLAWLYMTGEEPSFAIDHVNGDRADNRWSNIRKASQMENCCNRTKSKANKLGIKGVHMTHYGKYRARVQLAGKYIELGVHNTAEEAKAAYDAAAKILHGEFFRS